jgi:hypothetical protein
MDKVVDKLCGRCDTTKALTDFAKDASKKDGLQSKCKACQKELSGKHYQNNKPRYLETSNLLKSSVKEEVRRMKEAAPCTDCGRFYPYYVMDYDHLGEVAKVDAVSVMIKNRACLPTVLREIAKCELVCSNCHRIRTHERLLARGLDELDVEVVA